MRKFLAGVCLLAASATASANLVENFESYPDTASMIAAWSAAGAPAAGTVLNTDSSQYMFHPGGAVAARLFGPLQATAGNIVWEADIIDNGVGNKRVTTGLRDNGGGASLTALLEMGRYNSFTGGLQGYGVRTVFLPGSTDWQRFPNVSITAGRHHLAALITPSDITFTIDLNDDGTIDDTLVIAAASNATNYNIVRLGGPSGLSSAGGGLGFDDVSIQQVPEPVSLALLALGALALRRRG